MGDSEHDRPGEADLLLRRREAMEPPPSRRQAAARAGISPSQWSDVERGHKQAGSGIVVPVEASAQTLARMAEVVGATPDDLVAARRDDAARELRASAQQRQVRQRVAAVPGLGHLPEQALVDSSVGSEELLPLIACGLDAIDNSALGRRAKRELTTVFVNNLLHDATRRHQELLLMLRLAEGDHASD